MPMSANDACQCAGHGNESWGRLQHAIVHAAHLLPAQGPINVFIHHNTLHAFEDQPFDQAVQHGAKLFGCEPYLREQRFRAELARGRIRFDDLRAVLRDELGARAGDSLAGLATRLELRLAMLEHNHWAGSVPELHWIFAETDALRKVRAGVSEAARGRLLTETRRWVMRDLRGQSRRGPVWLATLFRDFPAATIESWTEATWEAFALEALWRVCQDGVACVPPAGEQAAEPLRHRDLLLALTAVDADALVHDLLIRFCAAFLDQGMAHWVLPQREHGFYACFLTLFSQAGGPPDAWLRGLAAEARRLRDNDVTPLACVAESLEQLGVADDQLDAYLSATLLALRGWGGMVLQMAQRGDRVAHPIPAHSLEEFLALRLLLDRFAVAFVAREELGLNGALTGLREQILACTPQAAPVHAEQRAFPLFQLAQDLGWSPEALYRLTPGEWALLVGEIEGFSDVERRRVFHRAYERRFRTQALDAIALHPRYAPARPGRPRFQAITCLDEREESFRRHLEEVAPDAETFGAAGFFNVAIYYRGAGDAYFVPLCPIVLQPQHWVQEVVSDGHEQVQQWRTRTRKALGTMSHNFHVGTRSFALGALLSAGLGVLASVPLVAGVLFPRLTARIRRLLGDFVTTAPVTRLNLERAEPTTGPAPAHQGYAIEEMATVAGRFLRDIGLTHNFARLILILGHGSDSLNNPHKSAYDCGACGGNSGAPNGRALAQMLNDPRVRSRLEKQGVEVPEDTWFLGGLHNTCDDSVTLADLERVPALHHADLARVQQDLHQVCDRNAHERCRRFMSAPLDLEPDEARRHVEGRSEDLAQTRPELGHATNALCIVGRRERTRGLFLDRRAFLTSYDPTQDDPQGTTLARLLGAAVPVCGGINLEYYFSHVDSQGYGCGTKLPHNLTSLLGVMDGAASDLRTGLPWQMVEIHEPVRLLFIVETTPETLTHIMDSNPIIGCYVRHGWVQMALLHPSSNALLLYQDGAFRPYQPEASSLPVVARSVDWYRGWRDHLDFAQIADEI